MFVGHLGRFAWNQMDLLLSKFYYSVHFLLQVTQIQLKLV